MLLLDAFSLNPVPVNQIKEAEKCLKKYFNKNVYLGIPARFVSHPLTRLPIDVAKFDAGVEHLSAFSFENFQRYF